MLPTWRSSLDVAGKDRAPRRDPGFFCKVTTATWEQLAKLRRLWEKTFRHRSISGALAGPEAPAGLAWKLGGDAGAKPVAPNPAGPRSDWPNSSLHFTFSSRPSGICIRRDAQSGTPPRLRAPLTCSSHFSLHLRVRDQIAQFRFYAKSNVSCTACGSNGIVERKRPSQQRPTTPVAPGCTHLVKALLDVSRNSVPGDKIGTD